jgi:DNA-binding transcriptional regulator LsrR (DeoR family)
MGSLRDIDEAVVVRACDMFVHGKKNSEILDTVNHELVRLNEGRRISREDVYRLLAMGRERGYFTFTPPERYALQTRVANTFNVVQNRVHVANSRSIDLTASTAAKLIVELILELGNKHDEVHVGLGGGYTTRLVAFHLATQLKAVVELPKLVLHALSTGFNPHGHHTAPVTFFGFFEGIAPKVEYVGLFAPPLVETGQYEEAINDAGVKKSFKARKKLHLVISSLGSASHVHGDFYNFMKQGKRGKDSGLNVLKNAGWVGDVLFRPYSATGPITDDTGIRAVSLLELDELRDMARSRDKHVVIVAGPCTLCPKTRSDAVKPLFEAPDLQLWSHFVMDMQTATELLAL